MNALAGAWTLIRLILRRDRLRILIWVVAILITLLGTAAVLPETYPTALDRQARARLIDNPAFRLIVGPAFGLENYTFGAMMASEMLGIMSIVAALMSIFMVVRHTRAEEENGRAELVRGSVVGRHASLAAILTVTTGVNLLIALATAYGLPAVLPDLSFSGSLLFGASMAVTGIVFAAIAAVSAQINQFARSASGFAIAVLIVSYVVRGLGDMLDNALTWTPPFGLKLQTAPYVLNRWWPLPVALALAAVLVPLALAMSTRRDIGAGMFAPRPGRAHASRLLSWPLGLAVRLQRGALMAWGAGLILFGLGIGALVSEVSNFYAGNPLVADYFTTLGLDLTDLTKSVLALYILIFAMLASVFAVSTVTRLRGEETSLRAENLLATAVSRTRWLGESLTFGILASTAILLATGLGMGFTYAQDAGNWSDVGVVTGAALAYAPALWLAVAIAVAVFGLFPRAMALAWFVPAYGGFAFMIGPLLGLPRWLYNLSAFEYVPRVPVDSFNAGRFVIMTAIAVALIFAGLLGIRYRDMDLV